MRNYAAKYIIIKNPIKMLIAIASDHITFKRAKVLRVNKTAVRVPLGFLMRFASTLGCISHLGTTRQPYSQTNNIQEARIRSAIYSIFLPAVENVKPLIGRLHV